MKYCTKCGNQLPDDSRFCDRCGTSSPDPVRQPMNQPVHQPVNQPVYQQPHRKPASGGFKWWIPVVAVVAVAALILTAVLLVGGIVSMLTVNEDAGVSYAEPEREQAHVPDVVSEPMETEPVESVEQGVAVYEVITQDRSYRNENGDILVRVTYDQVVLEPLLPEHNAINQLIQEDFESFINGIAYIYEDPPEVWEELMHAQEIPYDTLICAARAKVITNGEGILSIRYSTEWFMGGVFNADHYCLTFNLYTGQRLELAELSGLDEEVFAQQLREAVCAYLEPQRGELFGDPAEMLAQYSLEDFQYYLEDGQIVLEFPTYTFGPGYLGSTTVYTGIYAEAIQE